MFKTKRDWLYLVIIIKLFSIFWVVSICREIFYILKVEHSNELREVLTYMRGDEIVEFIANFV